MKSVALFLLIIVLLGCSSSNSNAVLAYLEDGTKPLPEDAQMPIPIGGIQEMMAKIEYPILAKKNNIEGQVFIEAGVDSIGNVKYANVTKGIGSGCDEEAMRVVKLTKFIPAEVDGIKVSCIVNIPFLFKLQEKKLKMFY